MTAHSNIFAGKFHGQRRLAGYGSRDHKESDMIEQRISIVGGFRADSFLSDMELLPGYSSPVWLTFSELYCSSKTS